MEKMKPNKACTEVYLLWHVHKITKENNQELLIGVFATRKAALEAKWILRNKKGFKSNPKGFKMYKHVVGLIGWTEGFITV